MKPTKKPAIDAAEFGSITVDGTRIEHDVVVRLSGKVEKRKKRLSKAVYGTSHTISLDEARDMFEKGMQLIIIGSGQQGMVKLSPEASTFFDKKDVKVALAPTPQAIDLWNAATGPVAGLFHVTC
jgi:hypothetical protein